MYRTDDSRYGHKPVGVPGTVRGLAPHAANRVYNLVGDETVTVKEIASIVRDLVGDVDILHVESRAGDFSGTEVHLASQTFGALGYMAKGSANVTSDQKHATVTGGGACGWWSPPQNRLAIARD